jgi:hypothetical protein
MGSGLAPTDLGIPWPGNGQRLPMPWPRDDSYICVMKTVVARRILASLAAVGLFVVALQGSSAAAEPLSPGRPVSVESLPAPLWLPGTERAYRIRYTSTSFTGDQDVVSGAVFVPKGVPSKLGWPVLSWAHGTVGVADPCAPSTAGRSQRDIDFLSAWLAAGYAIVATDYEGLGTPDRHAYLNGRSEAYGVIDAVRAARAVDGSLSRTWLTVGQSQGAQAALFTGAIAPGYAPELDFRGTMATAPPTQWRTQIAVANLLDPASPANPFEMMIFAGFAATRPELFHAADYLTPAGLQVLAQAATTDCFSAVAQQLAGHPSSDIFAMDAGELERLAQLLDRDSEVPVVRHQQPAYLAQGTADTVVYPPATQTTAHQLAAAGSDITFRFYPGADHNGVMPAALPDLLAWAAERLR